MTSLIDISERIKAAGASGEALRIVGSDSKNFYGDVQEGTTLCVADYAGIISYEPAEQVIVARCGTPLVEIESLLAEHGQALAFEPPHFGPATTIGGAIAAGLSGPARAYTGAARDFVLGVRIVDGLGNVLKFGGEVMKNVAGFDVSRLMTGSWGTLGVVAEVSLKLVPRAPFVATQQLELDEAAFIELINTLSGKPLPLSASYYRNGVARIRLAGPESSVRAAQAKIGGEPVSEDAAFWSALRDHLLEFFQDEAPLWRLSVRATCAPLGFDQTLIEWGGALRWIKSAAPAETIRAQAKAAGGSASLFRHGAATPRLAPLDPVLARLNQRIKQAFDPLALFSPGRLPQGA